MNVQQQFILAEFTSTKAKQSIYLAVKIGSCINSKPHPVISQTIDLNIIRRKAKLATEKLTATCQALAYYDQLIWLNPTLSLQRIHTKCLPLEWVIKRNSFTEPFNTRTSTNGWWETKMLSICSVYGICIWYLILYLYMVSDLVSVYGINNFHGTISSTFRLEPRQRITSAESAASTAWCQLYGASIAPFSPKCTIVSKSAELHLRQRRPVLCRLMAVRSVTSNNRTYSTGGWHSRQTWWKTQTDR